MKRNNASRVPPPSMLLALSEGGRAMGDYALQKICQHPLQCAPNGDGHAVVLCPGFLSDEDSMLSLSRFISSRGYDVYSWGLGRNMGPGIDGSTGTELERRVNSVYEQSGGEVTLVGWSLGGIIAREVAKRVPDQVRQVVMLGSLISGQLESSNLAWLYQMVAGPIDPEGMSMDAYRRRLQIPPAVPSTSIFSKADGIVAWRGCLEPKGPLTDNIEVYSSHSGMGVNPFALYAVADRLVEHKKTWKPFDRKAAVWRRFAYPSSGHAYFS